MAQGFAHKKGGYVGRLDPEERAVLTSLMEQVRGLLAPAPAEAGEDAFEALMRSAGLTRLGDELPGATASDELDDPDRDPALDRLLPDAHREDPLVSAEFRRMSAPGLRERKAAFLAAAIEVLGRPGTGRRGDEVRLDDEEAQALAIALTDVRLVVGERLALRSDSDADRLELALAQGELDNEQAWLVAVYDFLTWLQESLTIAMLKGLDEGE